MSIATRPNPFLPTPAVRADTPRADNQRAEGPFDQTAIGANDQSAKAGAFASMLATIVARETPRSSVDPKLTTPSDRRPATSGTAKRNEADRDETPNARIRPARETNQAAKAESSDDDEVDDDVADDSSISSAAAERSAFLRTPAPVRADRHHDDRDDRGDSDGDDRSNGPVATSGPTSGETSAGGAASSGSLATSPTSSSPSADQANSASTITVADPTIADASSEILPGSGSSTTDAAAENAAPLAEVEDFPLTGATPGQSGLHRSRRGLEHSQAGLHGRHVGITTPAVDVAPTPSEITVVTATPTSANAEGSAASAPADVVPTDVVSTDVASANTGSDADASSDLAAASALRGAETTPPLASAAATPSTTPNASSSNDSPTSTPVADGAANPVPATAPVTDREAAAVAPQAVAAASPKPAVARVRTDEDSATTVDVDDAETATVSTDSTTTTVDPAAGGVVPTARKSTRAEHASDTGETNRSASASAALAAAPGQDKTGTAKGGRPGRENRPDVAALGGASNFVAPTPARPAPTSAASEAVATLAAASTTPTEVADQLVTAAHRFQGVDGTHHVTLELNPHGLGAVAIDVTIDGTTVHLRMTAEHAATGDLLRSSLDELRSSLQKGGFTAGQFDVGQHRSGQHPQQRQASPGFDELWRGDRQAGNRLLSSKPQVGDRVRPTRTRTERRVDLAL